MSNLTRQRGLAYGALVFATVLWGSNPAVSRIILERVPPVSLVWLRWAIVLVLLAPAAWTERAALRAALRNHWKTLLGFALLGFAPQNVLVFMGLAGSSAMHLSLLNSAVPVLIILIGWLWLGRRPHGLESAGLLLSLAGVLLILGHGDPFALLRLDFNPWDLLLVAGMGVWAVYTLRMTQRPAMLSLAGFVFACALLGELVTLPLVAIELAWKGWPDFDMRTALALLYIGALPTLAAMLLFGYSVVRIGAVQSGILAHLVPVWGTLFAATLVGEQLYPYHGIGFLLVAGGAILSCFRPEPVLSSPPTARS